LGKEGTIARPSSFTALASDFITSASSFTALASRLPLVQVAIDTLNHAYNRTQHNSVYLLTTVQVQLEME
jgi:hypothetical protein